MSWQFYAFTFGMIFFVLTLVCVVIHSVAKQGNPNLPSPMDKAYWVKAKGNPND